MKRLLLLPLLLCWASLAQAAPLITVVAMVNNDAVTSYQLEKKLAPAVAAEKTALPPDSDAYQALRLKILDAMIEELLVAQRVTELGLSVSEEELTAAIEDVQRQNKLNREQLETALLAQGMSFDLYRQNLRQEILRYKLISREVRSKVEVTNTQIRAYFDSHLEEYMTQPTLRLGRISYPLADDADEKTRERLQQQAEIARQLLLDGKPFAEVLKGLGGEVEGGDMGAMVEAEMNPLLQEVVEGLEVGQVSVPKEALGSIHIFQVLERTPASAELTEEVSATIEELLAKQNSEKRFAEWKKELRKDAVIDIRI